MYTRILVPLDGSAVGEAALSYAQTLARGGQATVILLRVVERGAATEIAAADTYLRGLARGLESQGLSVELAIVYGGRVTDWIAVQASQYQADLVVMGTHGRGTLDRLVHGSVARAVFPRLPIPVLVIHAGTDGHLERQRFEQPSPSIVVGLDGSRCAEAGLAPARALAPVLGARIILVQVVPDTRPQVVTATMSPLAYVDDDTQARLSLEAQDYLLQLQRRLRAEGFEVYVDVRLGEPADQLRQAADTHSAAVLVVASHGRTGIERVLLGSVASNLLSRTRTPLIVVPAGAAISASEDAGVHVPQLA